MQDRHDPLTAIVFIGPPGSGKTACAAAVAKRLGWALIDTDRLIESETAMTVGQIFEQLGEPRFRDLETRLLDRLVSERAAAGGSSQPLVLATGGGMPVTPGNFERLEALGEVVALGADLDILAGRLLADGGRPLLAKGDDGDTRSGAELLKEKLERLIEPRAHVYARARYKLDTGGWTPEEIAEEVLKRLGLAS